jgi:hypothetical protein
MSEVIFVHVIGEKNKKISKKKIGESVKDKKKTEDRQSDNGQ